MMRIVGIDPGLQVTGYGVIACENGTPRLLEAGVIRTKSSAPLETRLRELKEGMGELLREFAPDAVSIEDLYSHYRHPKTAVVMGHARGVLLLAAGDENVPVKSYAATRIKKSLTGNGRATKQQVARMIFSTLECSGETVPLDATDALAAALCHIATANHGILL